MKTILKMLIIFSLVGGKVNAQQHTTTHRQQQAAENQRRQGTITYEQANYSQDASHEVYYYYLPDWEIYYYVPAGTWIYFNGKTWVYEHSAPDWFNANHLYKVDLDYDGQTPFMYHDAIKHKYPARNTTCGGPRCSDKRKLNDDEKTSSRNEH